MKTRFSCELSRCPVVYFLVYVNVALLFALIFVNTLNNHLAQLITTPWFDDTSLFGLVRVEFSSKTTTATLVGYSRFVHQYKRVYRRTTNNHISHFVFRSFFKAVHFMMLRNTAPSIVTRVLVATLLPYSAAGINFLLYGVFK